MRKIIFFLIAAVFISMTASVEAREDGRYELIQGRYTHTNLDSNQADTKTDLFLLDTSSGDVYNYISSETRGKKSAYWTPAVYDEFVEPRRQVLVKGSSQDSDSGKAALAKRESEQGKSPKDTRSLF